MNSVLNFKIGETFRFVVTSPVHCKAIIPRLIRLGLKAPAEGGPRLLMLDASRLLAQFMVGSHPHAELFHRRLNEILDQTGPRLRAFGEMVDILVQQENLSAALRLEEIWDEALAARSFPLFCAYAEKGFKSDLQTQEFHQICEQHSHVHGN